MKRKQPNSRLSTHVHTHKRYHSSKNQNLEYSSSAKSNSVMQNKSATAQHVYTSIQVQKNSGRPMNEYNSSNAGTDVTISNQAKHGNIQHLNAANYEETTNCGGSLQRHQHIAPVSHSSDNQQLNSARRPTSRLSKLSKMNSHQTQDGKKTCVPKSSLKKNVVILQQQHFVLPGLVSNLDCHSSITQNAIVTKDTLAAYRQSIIQQNQTTTNRSVKERSTPGSGKLPPKHNTNKRVKNYSMHQTSATTQHSVLYTPTPIPSNPPRRGIIVKKHSSLCNNRISIESVPSDGNQSQENDIKSPPSLMINDQEERNKQVLNFLTSGQAQARKGATRNASLKFNHVPVHSHYQQADKSVAIQIRPLNLSSEESSPKLAKPNDQKCTITQIKNETVALAKYGSASSIVTAPQNPRLTSKISGTPQVHKLKAGQLQSLQIAAQTSATPKHSFYEKKQKMSRSPSELVVADNQAPQAAGRIIQGARKIKRSNINFAASVEITQRHGSICLTTKVPAQIEQIFDLDEDGKKKEQDFSGQSEAWKAINGCSVENNNQNQIQSDQEMQAITPRSIQKPPQKLLEDSKLACEETSAKFCERPPRNESTNKTSKVIELSQIYQRKSIHGKTSSHDQGNFQKGATLQLQLHTRASPQIQQMSQQSYTQAFQSKQSSNTTDEILKADPADCELENLACSASTVKADDCIVSPSAVGKPPMAFRLGDRSQQMSRARRVKEENHKHSLALKKATAEATLNTNFSSAQKITDFGFIGANNCSNRSQILSTYTQEGFSTSATTANESDNLGNLTTDGIQSSAQLQRHQKGLQPIGIQSMNISTVIHSYRQPTASKNLQSQSSHEIASEKSTQQVHQKNPSASQSAAIKAEDQEERKSLPSGNKSENQNFKLQRQNTQVNRANISSTSVDKTSNLNDTKPGSSYRRFDFQSNLQTVSTYNANQSVPTTSAGKPLQTGSATPADQKDHKAQSMQGTPVKIGRKHVTDDFFLHQSKNSIQLRRVIDYEMKRKVQANPRLIYSATPKVSAHYWAIFDGHKQSFIHGKREYMKREVASLTKMMTAYTVIDLARQYKIKLNQTRITVCGVGSNVRGTTAKLKKGDILTAEELLYGCLLPSGNDAAFVLAKYFGRLIFDKKGYDERDMQRIRSYQFNYHPYYVKYFLKQMNDNAVSLKLLNTFFDSPHGLMNPQNVSTAYDMARLTSVCMGLPLFKRIVGTKTYETRALRAIQKPLPPSRPPNRRGIPQGTHLSSVAYSGTNSSYEESSEQSSSVEEKFETIYKENENPYHWVNTNRLLGIDGFSGAKTGITEAAGACLSCSFEKDGHFIIVILLQSKTMEARWEEAQLLIDWAIQRRQLMAPIPQSGGTLSSHHNGASRAASVKHHN